MQPGMKWTGKVKAAGSKVRVTKVSWSGLHGALKLFVLLSLFPSLVFHPPSLPSLYTISASTSCSDRFYCLSPSIIAPST